jgi:hypothetical protein
MKVLARGEVRGRENKREGSMNEERGEVETIS